ncbi:MAG TPA: APC family permease [Pseudogracilibacillus sp.]|nr:APC family permease [Pseudogracilibacillus sp.]
MEKRTTLKKSLKAHWVWAIALGSAIGWGAFVQPINWMQTAGPLGVILGFSIGALLMMLIAISYGFLIRSFPVSGGEFAYAFISLGRTHAFISGWFLTLGYICIVALNASALALMVKYVFPRIVENFHLYTIAGWEVYGMEIIIATLALIIFGFLNVKGTGLSGRMQFIFALVMVAGVLILTLTVGMQPGAGLANVQPLFPANTTAFAAVISIVAIAPWAYVGFDAVPQAAEEFDFPAKKAFTLIILALVFAAGIYSFMILATSMASPWEAVAAENHLWGTGAVIQELVGPIGLVILVVALSMGIFTGLNGFTLASSRLLFAMARAKIIPSAFRKLHPKHGTPHMAIIFTIIISAAAPWFGREALVWVVDMSSIGVSIAYLYTCITAYYLFKWNDQDVLDPAIQEASPFKKFISLVGIIASVTFIGLLLIPGSPAFLGIESRIALIIWVLLGVVFYLFKRKEYNAIPEKELRYLILGKRTENE